MDRTGIVAITYEDAIQIMQQARIVSPSLVNYGGNYHAFSRTRLLGSGGTYEAALRAAKLLPLPARAEVILFAAAGSNVMRGNLPICVARSPNYARRIANALNAYTPNDRGI
jgi:hypothetical protein